MVDPVVASDGRSYERMAIAEVLRQPNPLSPITREPLDVGHRLITNWNLKKRIEDYEEEMMQYAIRESRQQRQ